MLGRQANCGNTVMLVIYSRYQNFRQVIIEGISKIPTLNPKQPQIWHIEIKELFL